MDAKQTWTEKVTDGLELVSVIGYVAVAAFTWAIGEAQAYVYELEVGHPTTARFTVVCTPALSVDGVAVRAVQDGAVTVLCGRDIPLRLVPDGSVSVVVVVHTRLDPDCVQVVPEFPEVVADCASALVRHSPAAIAASKPNKAFIQTILLKLLPRNYMYFTRVR